MSSRLSVRGFGLGGSKNHERSESPEFVPLSSTALLPFFDTKTDFMLDEMTVLRSSRKSKMLAAHPTILEALPFMESYISFKPFVNFLKEKKTFSF